jgi:hypothetical protein
MTDPPPSAPAAPNPPPPRRGKVVVFLAGCLLVFGLVATGLHFLGPRSAPPGVTMADLHGLADLQDRFNADRGQPRLVVILSPT